MEYLIGLISTVFIVALAKFTKFENDRSFYPTILIVIGLLYVLFAVIDGGRQTILFESLIAIVFMTIAVIGSKKSQILVGIGIILHGIFDISHPLFWENKGVPIFWAGFCSAIDVTLGAYVIWEKSGSEK